MDGKGCGRGLCRSGMVELCGQRVWLTRLFSRWGLLHVLALWPLKNDALTQSCSNLQLACSFCTTFKSLILIMTIHLHLHQVPFDAAACSTFPSYLARFCSASAAVFTSYLHTSGLLLSTSLL
jgi:hypothetical protein